MLPDETINKVVDDIAHNHRKIIDDWCKAYIAQIYEETGQCPKPGDFILNQQEMDFKSGRFGFKYWFDPKTQKES